MAYIYIYCGIGLSSSIAETTYHICAPFTVKYSPTNSYNNYNSFNSYNWHIIFMSHMSHNQLVIGILIPFQALRWAITAALNKNRLAEKSPTTRVDGQVLCGRTRCGGFTIFNGRIHRKTPYLVVKTMGKSWKIYREPQESPIFHGKNQ